MTTRCCARELRRSLTRSPTCGWWGRLQTETRRCNFTIISIRTEQPSARIIVLTTYAGDVLAQRVLKAGAQAYVLKSLVRTEILNTIRVVYAGEKQVQADVAAEIAKHTAHALLTARELEVLKLVASGYANKAISAHLEINEEIGRAS